GDFARVRAPVLFIEPGGTEAIVDGERVTLEDALRERADAGLASIVVLPKWSWQLGEAAPDEGAQDVLSAALPGATLVRAEPINEPMRNRSATGSLGEHAISIPWLQTIEGHDEALLSSEGRAIVVRRTDGGIVLSDPDLVHNWNLHRADHARLVLDVIRMAGESAGDAVVIDEVFHGHGERRSLGSALGEFPAGLLEVHAAFVVPRPARVGSRRVGPAGGRAAP